MNLDNVKQEDWIVGGLALFLVIALLAFPWYHIGLGPLGSLDRSASSSPYAIWGILAVLTSLALLAYMAVHLFSPQTNLPAINNSPPMTRLAIVGATALLLVIKFLAHIGSFGWGFFVILVAMNKSWLAGRDSDQTILKWAEHYCANNYEEVGLINISDQGTDYYLSSPPAGIPPTADHIVIFRRKS